MIETLAIVQGGALLALVVALLVVVFKLVAANKEGTDAIRQRDALTLDNAGLVAQAGEHVDQIGKLKSALIDAQAERDAFKAAAIVDLPDDAVRDIVNGDVDGLLAFPGRSSGDAGRDTAAGEIAVRDVAAPGQPGGPRG